MKYIALTPVTPKGEATIPAGGEVDTTEWTEERIKAALEQGLIARESDEEVLAEVLPLAPIDGISVDTAVALNQVGVTTTEELQAADTDTIAQAAGLPETTVKRARTAVSRAAQED